MKTYLSSSASETKKIASKLAKTLEFPTVICLYGDLGSGKTTFSKGFAAALGIVEKTIKSPTYNIVKSYSVGSNLLHHFDFYRLSEIDELTLENLEEMIDQKNAISLIEWPERIEKLLPSKRLNIYFSHENLTTRKISLDL